MLCFEFTLSPVVSAGISACRSEKNFYKSSLQTGEASVCVWGGGGGLWVNGKGNVFVKVISFLVFYLTIYYTLFSDRSLV